MAACALGLLATILFTPAGDGKATPLVTRESPTGLATQRPGPLRPLKANPRYFTDGRSGRPIYLTGSHTWWNQGDETWPVCGGYGRRGHFDFDAYLDRISRWGHNFVRLWRNELTRWVECGLVNGTSLQPWPRTGPAAASDGRPRFDLSQFDPRYFDRLRNRVAAARKRGIYVGVMLFEGFGTQLLKEGWTGHPFNRSNNVNGIDGDSDGNNHGVEIHRPGNGSVLALQRAYVRKVVDTLNLFDNVIWEVVNEAGKPSTQWQYQMIAFVRRYEATKPKQHPIGMTLAAPDGANEDLFGSPAAWVSPGGRAYEHTPAAAEGGKVSILDTDHVCQICGNSQVVWKWFTRGHNVILMDPLDEDPGRIAARQAMGMTRRLSRRIGLARMRPSAKDCSTGFCLVNRGREYLVYQPAGGRFLVNLGTDRRTFVARWYDPRGRGPVRVHRVRGSFAAELVPPFAGEAVAHLRAIGNAP